jgi:hypothetical protein
MAKYRISSIPQSLPKNQFGGLFKKRKKKENQNSIINYTPPSEETMVQGIEPQSNYYYNTGSADDFSYPHDETLPQYNVDNANYFGRARTPEEEANTFAEPFMWTQGETIPGYTKTYNFQNPLRNPVTERSYQHSLQRKLGMPYTSELIQGSFEVPEQFIPDYFAPVTETGEPLKCTDGKIAYKGQCITEEAYAIIAQRELDKMDFDFQKKREENQKEFELKMNEIKRKNEEWEDYMYDRNIKDYYAEFDKSSKKDKIRPFQSAPTDELQYLVPVKNPKTGEPEIDKKTGQPKMQTAEESLKDEFLVHRTENGFTELYPLDIVYDRIVNNGFFNNEFKEYWGLDPKQVEAQVGDIMKQSKGQYDATVYDKILNRSLDRGISPDEAAGTFSTRLGYASAFRKDHAPKVQKAIDIEYEKFINEQLKNLRKEIGVTDDDGTIRYDHSKKDDKQKVNFDFNTNIYKDTYDDSGALIGREFDVVGNYAKAWINSAPNAKEKAARQAKVNAIYNKDYSAEGKKAYDESLNAPGSGYNADPYNGMSAQQVNAMYGDRMQTLRTNNLTQFNNKAVYNALGAKEEAIKAKRDEDLAKATGFNDDFQTYMKNTSRIPIYQTYRDALTSGNITNADKAKVLGALKNKKYDQAINVFMGKEDVARLNDNKFSSWNTYQDRFKSIGSFQDYMNRLDWNDRYSISAGTPSVPLTFGDKLWDVVTNPFDAAYYALNGRGESMWGSSNKSYNQRKEDERRFGVDLGTYKDIGPLSVLNIFNSLNPLNIGDELYRGYQANGLKGLSARGSDLSWDAAMAAATFIPGGQGLKLAAEAAELGKAAEVINAARNTGTLLNRTVNTGKSLLNTGMRGFNAIERGLNSTGVLGQYVNNLGKTMTFPLAVDALRPYGDFDKGFTNLYEGNIGEGLGDIAYGTLGVLPLLNRIPLSYQTQGGKLYGLGLNRTGSQYPEGLTYATNAKNFAEMVSPSLKKDYFSLSKELHPDKFSQFGEAAELAANKQFQNLSDIYLGNQFKSVPFTESLQIGRMQPKYTFDLGRFGQLNYGQNVFKPMTLQEMVTGRPAITNTTQTVSGALPQSTTAVEEVNQVGRRPKKLTNFFKGRKIRYQDGGATGNPVIDSLRQLGKKQYGGLPKAQTGGSGLVKAGNRLSTIYRDIAEGGNLFKYAWQSPAMRFDLDAPGMGTLLNVERMPQSQALFNAIQSYTPETTLNKIISKDYEITSGPYTGRFVSKIDDQRKEILKGMMKTAKISSEDPMVLSRRIKINDPKLFSLESGIYTPNRPLSFSAGRDAIGNQVYSGGADRLVMKLDPGQYNIFKNFYSDFTPEDLAAYENFLYQYGAGHTLPQFTTHDMIANNLGMAKFNRSSERELLTPYEASFGEIGRVKNNFGGYDVIAQPIGLDITQPTWLRPSYDDLVREFDVEHQRKGLGFFNSEGEFINAANQGVVRDVTPDLDMTIRNRSFTPTAQDLINLSKTYRSWGPYRNEGTIQSIYEGLNQGGNMTMPMVIQYGNGLNRILSGNTRMDAARHLGLTPQALFIKAPFKKGGIAMKLSKKEIDKYIEDGYIIEDE